MVLQQKTFPTVKITTKNCRTETFIDDTQLHNITGIKATWDNSGFLANVTITMLANVELESDSIIIPKFKLSNDIVLSTENCLNIGNNKYKLVKIQGGQLPQR